MWHWFVSLLFQNSLLTDKQWKLKTVAFQATTPRTLVQFYQHFRAVCLLVQSETSVNIKMHFLLHRKLTASTLQR